MITAALIAVITRDLLGLDPAMESLLRGELRIGTIFMGEFKDLKAERPIYY
jgi:hypothetical protein